MAAVFLRDIAGRVVPETSRALRFIPAGGTVQVRLQATILADLTAGTEVLNRAIVAVRGDPARPEAEVGFRVVSPPEYRLSKRLDEGRARAGDPVSFTLLVENSGSVPVRALLLRDILPEGLNYIPGSTRLTGRVVPDVAGESQLRMADVGSDGGELPVARARRSASRHGSMSPPSQAVAL